MENVVFHVFHFHWLTWNDDQELKLISRRIKSWESAIAHDVVEYVQMRRQCKLLVCSSQGSRGRSPLGVCTLEPYFTWNYVAYLVAKHPHQGAGTALLEQLGDRFYLHATFTALPFYRKLELREPYPMVFARGRGRVPLGYPGC